MVHLIQHLGVEAEVHTRVIAWLPETLLQKKKSEQDPYLSYKEETRRETEAQDCHSPMSEGLTAPSPPQNQAQGGWMDTGPGDSGLTETGSLAGQG